MVQGEKEASKSLLKVTADVIEGLSSSSDTVCGVEETKMNTQLTQPVIRQSVVQSVKQI